MAFIKHSRPLKTMHENFSGDLTKLNDYILNNIIGGKKVHSNISGQRVQQQHYLQLVKNISNISNNQAFILDSDVCNKFMLSISPNDGPYSGGCFLFFFNLPLNYPHAPPIVQCQGHIYHPNIDDDGEVCMSILDEWRNDSNDLLDCVQGLLNLFHHPNLEDPLSPYFSPNELNKTSFESNVKLSMSGGVIDGVAFDNVLLYNVF
ncbi:uncharacterized protein LOC100198375 [Hydra vulgaris]|uniref:uncharacterized protein LOC100198375 n=1 Tax=Hydra vulgaris TaxID=6087 RepID=UPI0001923F54|nr:NEDD8-conjugating enzyme ubc12 [Hydra vulgaris]XP_012561253.1 NEDD8-conjugating enzyme ubc12 [Hydra vulgaris]XP_012561254.1 NEDD8-conjugating enzyme ubc12 [Hydra vulgaris]XP_047128238.1 NEDD8-conjugating enzyme ubc12 [Hydra vulgaris]